MSYFERFVRTCMASKKIVDYQFLFSKKNVHSVHNKNISTINKFHVTHANENTNKLVR